MNVVTGMQSICQQIHRCLSRSPELQSKSCVPGSPWSHSTGSDLDSECAENGSPHDAPEITCKSSSSAQRPSDIPSDVPGSTARTFPRWTQILVLHCGKRLQHSSSRTQMVTQRAHQTHLVLRHPSVLLLMALQAVSLCLMTVLRLRDHLSVPWILC